MTSNGDDGTNNLSTRARAWFERLTRAKKALATSAALVITIGAVASATTSVLDLGGRLGAGGPQAERISPVKTSVRRETRVREGVLVTEVIPGSAADRAGVEVQDVVTDINGKAIEDVDDFEDTLKRTRTGETLLLSLIRDSQRESLPVKLEPIEGTDIRLGTRTEDIEPDNVVQVWECSLCLPTPGTPAIPSQGPTGAELNPAVKQYAP